MSFITITHTIARNIIFIEFLGVAVAASVFTITAMSVDRYLAITQTIRIPKLPNRKWAVLVIGLLWIIAVTIFAPMLWIVVLREETVPIMNGTVSIIY